MSAELEALAKRAETIDQGTAAPADDAQPGAPEILPEEGASRAKLIEENEALLDLVLGIIKPALPFIREIWTAEKVREVATAGAAVEEKYGVSLTDIFGPWKEEIGLAVALVPPSIATYHASKAYIAHMREQAKQAESAKPAAPGGDGGSGQ